MLFSVLHGLTLISPAKTGLTGDQIMYQADVYRRIAKLIPADLWIKYKGHTFAEMAELPELEEWSRDLRKAEADWFAAEDA